jgi:hypothetical protein
MADKNYSIGYKFTGDASGFTRSVDEMNRSFTGVVKGVKSMVGGFVAVGTAIEVAKKAMNSTEASSDALDKMMGTLQGTMQGLFRTIVTGDWDQLIKNIVNTAKATRDLKVAMDELEDIVSTNKIRKALFEGQLEEARLGAAGTTDPGKKASFIQAAIDAQKNLTALEKNEVNQRIAIEEEYFKTMMGWPDDMARFNIEKIKEIAKNYEYFFGENSAVVEGINISLSRLEQSGTKDQEYWRLKTLKSSLEIFKQLRDVSDPGRFRQYIELIAEGYSVTAKGSQDLVRLTKQFTTASEATEKLGKDIKKAFELTEKVQTSILPQNATVGTLQPFGGTSAELAKVQNSAEELANTFENMFESMIQGSKSFGEILTEEIQRIAASILSKAAVWAMLKLGGDSSIDGTTFVRYILGAKDSGVSGYASGTNFAPGGLSLVGERGPELVNLPRGSQVIPNGRQSMRLELVSKVKGSDLALVLSRYQSQYESST